MNLVCDRVTFSNFENLACEGEDVFAIGILEDGKILERCRITYVLE